MIILKEVIHSPKTNSVEATWVERTVTPAVGVEGEEGYQPERIEDVQIKCHSYADVQMDMLEADIAALGGNLADHAALIAMVRANIKPPIPEPVIIPAVVTMRQARLALLQQGLLANVNAAVAAADEATKITWEFSSEVHRNHPFVATLAVALGLTEAQLDDLFILAGGL